MSERLTDRDISDWLLNAPRYRRTTEHLFMWSALEELQRLRAMEKRLETWAEQLDKSRYSGTHAGVGPYIAAELRNRMRGEP